MSSEHGDSALPREMIEGKLRHLRLEGSDELGATEREAVVDVVREVVQRALGSFLRCGTRAFNPLPRARRLPLRHVSALRSVKENDEH